MIKKLGNNMYSNSKCEAEINASPNGYMLIGDPLDIAEMVKDPKIIPSKILKKIILNGINRLDKENMISQLNLKNTDYS